MTPRKYALTTAAAAMVAAPASAQSGMQASASLHIHFEGIQTQRGALMIGLFDNQADYRAGEKGAKRGFKLAVSAASAELDVAALKPGTYAVQLYHDLNGDGKLAKNFIGMPTEPVAFSNNAHVSTHAPAWSETRFTVRPGDNRINITVR